MIQFKHLMQPFDVALSPDGVEVLRRDGRLAGPESSSKGLPVAAVTLSVVNRYDHMGMKDFWDTLSFGWEVEVDGSVIAHGDLSPPPPTPLGDEGRVGNGDAAAAPTALPTMLPSSKRVRRVEGDGDANGDVDGDSDNDSVRKSTTKAVFEVPSQLVAGQEMYMTVTGRMRRDTSWVAAGHVVGRVQLALSSEEVRRLQA